MKSGSLVLIHGQVLKVAKQWSSAFAKVTALSTNIVFFCDKTRQWSNSGGIKRESSALSSSDVRLVQLIIVQVAHKSERNLSSSSRHAYTFHVIGQTVGYHQDGDDENLSYSFVFFTLTEMEGSFYASKNWLQVMKNCVKKQHQNPEFLPDSTPALLLHLQPPVGGELPKLYREEEACVQETSQLKWIACVQETSQLKGISSDRNSINWMSWMWL